MTLYMVQKTKMPNLLLLRSRVFLSKTCSLPQQNANLNQRTIGPENAHMKPGLGVLSHHEMTLTLNTHTPLLTS